MEEARPIISTCALQYDINDRSMMISRQSGCLHYADTEFPECSQDAVQGLHRRRHAVTATHSAKYKIVSASNLSYTMLCSPHPHLCPSVYLLNTLRVSTVSHVRAPRRVTQSQVLAQQATTEDCPAAFLQATADKPPGQKLLPLSIQLPRSICLLSRIAHGSHGLSKHAAQLQVQAVRCRCRGFCWRPLLLWGYCWWQRRPPRGHDCTPNAHPPLRGPNCVLVYTNA